MVQARFHRLADWLSWQETLHPKSIDLGLDRVARVANRMGLLPLACPVISVAGTNGKGSSVAMLDAIYRAAGYRTLCYTSPHLLRYNERIRIGGEEVADRDLCECFAAIDAARGEISLSYFEFGTLASLVLVQRHQPDIAILEVGLGGRLDAVNIVDADAALVTSIAIDHVEWLGTDRETIAREKAGIFRAGRPAVCSDPSPPESLRAVANELGADWYAQQAGYSIELAGTGWAYQGREAVWEGLPAPALPGRHQYANAAGVLAVVECLLSRLPVTDTAIAAGLRQVTLTGRAQYLPGTVGLLLDVAHNPAGAATLAGVVEERRSGERVWVVLGMLAGKDAAGFAEALRGHVDFWCLADLPGERGLSAQALQQTSPVFAQASLFPGVSDALQHTLSHAAPGDLVVACGSFVTVAAALSTRYSPAVR